MDIKFAAIVKSWLFVIQSYFAIQQTTTKWEFLSFGVKIGLIKINPNLIPQQTKLHKSLKNSCFLKFMSNRIKINLSEEKKVKKVIQCYILMQIIDIL